jgi:hypothetical protein
LGTEKKAVNKYKAQLSIGTAEKIDGVVRQQIVELVNQFVPQGDPSRNAALVMVTGLFVGPSVSAVAETTGCPVELVRNRK